MQNVKAVAPQLQLSRPAYDTVWLVRPHLSAQRRSRGKAPVPLPGLFHFVTDNISLERQMALQSGVRLPMRPGSSQTPPDA